MPTNNEIHTGGWLGNDIEYLKIDSVRREALLIRLNQFGHNIDAKISDSIKIDAPHPIEIPAGCIEQRPDIELAKEFWEFNTKI